MTWGMRWHHWREHYHKWALLPKCPSALHNVADHHPNDLYHLSIDKVTRHMKIRCTIASTLRVTLGEGGDQPPPPHAWTSLLIADMFLDGLEEWITEAVVLAPKEVILFFGWQLLREELPLGDARDVGFDLGSPVNWARREAQVEMMMSTLQESHQTITDAIMEKRTKARGASMPQMNNEDKPDPCNTIQHWRVDVRIGGRCFQSGGEKWQSE